VEEKEIEITFKAAKVKKEFVAPKEIPKPPEKEPEPEPEPEPTEQEVENDGGVEFGGWCGGQSGRWFGYGCAPVRRGHDAPGEARGPDPPICA
jgi:hypothetical protein